MSTLLFDSTISPAIWIVVKTSALLGLAGLVQAALAGRGSAAARHLAWVVTLCALLLLPAASWLLPSWDVTIAVAPPPIEHATDAAPVEAPRDAIAPAVPALSSAAAMPAPRGRAVSWPAAIAVIYLGGMIAILARLLMQHANARRFARRAVLVQDAGWTHLLADCALVVGVRRRVRLLRSPDGSVPMALGTRRPSIVIPSIADGWDEDRRRAVLMHELAHVARFDCFTQAIAVLACAIYWLHPAVWWVARRLRVERELACDDRVIAAGTEAREYAGHLLEIAYASARHPAPALAVAMARPRQLEGRMLAALDARRNRRVPAPAVRRAGAAAAALVVLVLAVARPTVAAAVRAPDGDPPAAASTQQDPPPAADLRKAAAVIKKQEARGSTLTLRDVPSRIRNLVRAAAAAIGIGQDGLPGTWEIRPTETNGVVHLRIVEFRSSYGSNVPIDQFEGLTAAQLTGAGGPIQFRLRRDAGTFSFDGVIHNGVGAGTFSFTPDANFPAEMARRGFARPTAAEQYQLARHDVGYAFIDELNRQGYTKPQTADLVRAGQHGVHSAYLRDMGALGYRLGALDALITLRDHGITPEYVRELADDGYKGLAADDLRQARDHGVTSDYVRGMRDGGYGSLPMNDLINLRDHGVTPQFIRGLGDAGYRRLPIDQLLRVRDHGVSAEYARDMRGLGYTLPIDDFVRARDHGVTVDYVRELAALGYGDLPIDSLIRIRDHGVTTEYVREMKELGYDRLGLDDLVTLRDHGLTADRIRRANARAGTRLPVDLLKSLAAGGAIR